MHSGACRVVLALVRIVICTDQWIAANSVRSFETCIAFGTVYRGKLLLKMYERTDHSKNPVRNLGFPVQLANIKVEELALHFWGVGWRGLWYPDGTPGDPVQSGKTLAIAIALLRSR